MSLMAKENFFDSEREYFTQLKAIGYEPSVVLDIGASNGQWSLRTAQMFPQAAYHLFEPLTLHNDAYKQAHERMRNNSKINFHVYDFGLSDVTGERDFFERKKSFGSSYMGDDNPKWVDRTHSVPMCTLDSVAKESGLDKVDIVKMDTQGSELDIMRGGRNILRTTDVLLVETWLYRSYNGMTPLMHEIIEEASGLGLKLSNVGAPFFDTQGVLYCLDCFFCSEKILDLLAAKAPTESR